MLNPKVLHFHCFFAAIIPQSKISSLPESSGLVLVVYESSLQLFNQY